MQTLQVNLRNFGKYMDKGTMKMATLNMPRAQSVIAPRNILRVWIQTEFNITLEMRTHCEGIILAYLATIHSFYHQRRYN